MTGIVPSAAQEAANRICWSPGARAFYEVHYVMWWDTAHDVMGWVRYMLFTGRGRSEAALWGGVMRLSDPQRGLTVKEIHPTSAVSLSASPFRFAIGDSEITTGTARGSLGSGDTQVSWSVAFDEPGIEIAHLPAPLRNMPIPPTKFISACCGGRLSGFIEVAGTRYDVTLAPAVHSHFWGPKNVVGWSWGHCSNFREDSGFVFDGVFVDSKLAGLRMKPLSIFFFRMDGVTYEANGLVTALFRNASESDISGWRFSAHCDDLVFRGTVLARPEEMNLWIHEDPDGEERLGHVTCTADYSIEVLRREGGSLRPVRTVTAPRAGIFEITRPTVEFRIAHRHPTHLIAAQK